MKFLELKIPPVILVLVFILSMLALRQYSPEIGFEYNTRLILFILISVLSALMSLSGVMHFRTAKTTVDPRNPEKSAMLVTNGIYRYTRNPMYLGFVFFLTGFSIFLNSAYSLILVPIFIIYITLFQIIPEEKILLKIFAQEFIKYKNSVRRWL
ncbi:methyltransferase family protein [Microbulbifer spongiae]|uniref:Isoprenylcysteine carboxylmethyltransferase family protein n=1 Tax=Microbulbifer spongiae TaxID=2944933 RepID=A0ABY9EE21_9GAMM|nr:isoprenylcysteine carboxylmethyltransferase family protein [Microbulbifer sp. MI-G]WKD51249.1 isoprenylcysteine carboxylmethyltransferase family protein [Microbulbifer sp. MI-G]